MNFFLFIVVLYSITSAAFTPSINGATEFLTWYPKLFSSIPNIPHNLSIIIMIIILILSIIGIIIFIIIIVIIILLLSSHTKSILENTVEI